ncbi:hypothetical protein A9K55_004000 [Cordyceps militaris]|uniref:Metallopeptidase, catalytic domain n=1 Tax=Cordyceps militaris TaxID=73501 RepID=A0A2H4SPJ7_CORMI|nr:hypothetical protein A9K55_004000 [Cordyceps militaris]
MWWSRVSLIASVFVSIASAGVPATNDSFDTSDAFELLYPRDNPSSKIDDLFELGDSCKGKVQVLQGWLDEIKKMHSDFETAAREASGIPPFAVVFRTFFGTMPLKGMVEDTGTMKEVKTRIAGVTQFLNGGGLRKARGPGKPLLVCSDSEFEHEDPDSAVRDDKGEYIVSKRDPNTNEPVAYLGFRSVFKDLDWSFQHVFWCNNFKGYVFASKEKICSDTLQGGVTPKTPEVAQGQAAKPFTIGEPSRLLLLCPLVFGEDGKTATAHSFPSLAEAVDPDNYPEGDLKQKKYQLDRMLPRSATFYHELYHLTDNDDTRDPSYSLTEILEAAKDEGPVRSLYTQNPESYVYAAVANYLYLNGPFINQRVVYSEGYFPELESDVFPGAH